MMATPNEGLDTAASGTVPDRAPRVVVGVDGSNSSLGALGEAVHEALGRGAQLQIVTAWRFPTSAGLALMTSVGLEDDAKAIVDEAASRIRSSHPGLVVHESVSSLAAMVALVDASAGAELLVVGSEGRGAFSRMLIGSVSQHAAIHAHCPVMVARPPATPEPPMTKRPIVVGIDGSEPATSALGWAIDEAQRQDVALRLISAWTASPVFATRSEVCQAAESVLEKSLAHAQSSAPGLVVEGSTY